MSTVSMFQGTGSAPDSGRSGSLGKPLTDTAELWTKRQGESEELKQYHQPDWIKYWRWYLNWAQPLTDPYDWWRSNAPDPEPYKIVETILPKHVLGTFAGQEYFTVKGRERQDAEYSKIVQSLLTYMMERMDIFPRLYECLKYTLIMGHSWGKITWKIEAEDRVKEVGEPVFDDEGNIIGVKRRRLTDTVEVYNDPWFDWVMNDKIWCDTTGAGRWFMERIDTTLTQLKETDKQLRIYKNLNLVEKMGPQIGQESYDETREGLGIETSTTQPQEDDAVMLWQCWGWVPPELRGADGNAWRLTVIANGIVEIRDDAIPTPDNRPPYFPIKAVPVPGRLYGESILRWIGPKIDQKSTLANMRLDEVKLGVWQQYVYDKEAVTTSQGLVEPGGGIGVDTSGRSINDVFALIPRKPIMAEAYREEAALKETIEDAAAAGPVQQGVADTSRQTATEINRLGAMGDQRYILQAMWIDHTVKKQILTRGFKYYQKQLPADRLVRIVGEDFSVPIDISQIQEDVDIVVMSGLEAFGRESRLQSVAEFIQLAGTDAFAPWLKPGNLLKQLAEDRGWRDTERFVKTDEEFQKDQQANLQMQAQMMQMEAMMEAMSKQAGEQVKGKVQMALGQQKLQIEGQKAQMDVKKKQMELQMKAAELGMKLEGQRNELELDRQRMGMDLAGQAAKTQMQIRASRESGKGVGGGGASKGRRRK